MQWLIIISFNALFIDYFQHKVVLQNFLLLDARPTHERKTAQPAGQVRDVKTGIAKYERTWWSQQLFAEA